MKQARFIISKPYPWVDDVAIRFGITDGERLAVAQPVTMIDIPIGEVAPDSAMLVLERGMQGLGALQSLMDQLWQQGIRPSDIGTPGHLEATKLHLNDMRQLVGKQLGVELK